MNVWNLAISPDGQHLAAEVRLNLYEYTIAVDGVCLAHALHHRLGAGVQPHNRSGGRAGAGKRPVGPWPKNGNILWDQRFVQAWHQMFSPDGSRLAAIVAPKYGRWTVAVDGVAWPVTFTKLVTDVVFSPDSRRIAALAKDDETFRVVVDGSPWSDRWDMVWKPVFSP